MTGRTIGQKISKLFFAAAVLACGATIQASAQTAATGPDPESGEATVQVGGQRVAIDPQTGRLRQPTPAERQALIKGLEQILSRSTEGLEITKNPDGTEAVNLEGRFRNIAVGKRNADGTVSSECVTNIEEAKEFLNPDTKKPAAPVKPKATTKSTKKMRPASRKGK